jgi:hypothetical protein
LKQKTTYSPPLFLAHTSLFGTPSRSLLT